jgi:hypothetical protein
MGVAVGTLIGSGTRAGPGAVSSVAAVDVGGGNVGPAAGGAGAAFEFGGGV